MNIFKGFQLFCVEENKIFRVWKECEAFVAQRKCFKKDVVDK